MNKKGKAVLLTGAALSASYLAIGEALFSIFMTRPGITFTSKHFKPVDEEGFKLMNQNQEIKDGDEWYNATENELVKTETRSSRPCHGYFFKTNPDSHKYVICCHGYSSEPSFMGSYGKRFSDMGFNILFPVFCGHFDSETNIVTMGWKDRLIVTAFVDYIVSEDPEAQIVLHGVSMGGATVMMATGERMPENVKCCVEDCGYTNAWDVFCVQVREYLGLSVFPFITAANTVCRLQAKFGFKECSALEQVKKSNTPTLFIHGNRDTFVPFWMLHPLFENAVCEKQKLIVDGALHACSAYINPDLYWKTIAEFIAKYVK